MTETKGSDPSVWTVVALRACGMPPEEIRAVLGAEDPEIVRRHIELHVERLEERVARQRAILDRVRRQLGELRRSGRRELRASTSRTRSNTRVTRTAQAARTGSIA